MATHHLTLDQDPVCPSARVLVGHVDALVCAWDGKATLDLMGFSVTAHAQGAPTVPTVCMGDTLDLGAAGVWVIAPSGNVNQPYALRQMGA